MNSRWDTYKRIGQIISDGRTTGGDIEATAERLGNWHKSIKQKAKPFTIKLTLTKV